MLSASSIDLRAGAMDAFIANALASVPLAEESAAGVWRSREIEAQAAVSDRDMVSALEAMGVGRTHCFVWPETYPKTYRYQRLSWCNNISGFPVVMRGAKTSIYAKYGKGAHCARVADRFLRLNRVTELGNCKPLIRSLVQRICQRHELALFPQWARDFIWRFDGVVLVDGRPIPVSADRLAALEKSVAIIEKIDRLDARKSSILRRKS